jgi:Protein of unknown function (DUF3168)
MALAENIFSKLKTDAGVIEALGSLVDPENVPIYPVQAPSKAPLPMVVWMQVSSSNNETQSEASELDSTWLQFSCFSDEFGDGGGYKQARNLRRAVRKALENQRLDDGEVMVDFTERDLFEKPLDAWHCVLECHVLHNALAGAT